VHVGPGRGASARLPFCVFSINLVIMQRNSILRLLLPGFVGIVLLVTACDPGFSGVPLENQPPRTFLSVRDSSLVDNVSDENRFTSTVFVSWYGDDPDGYVDHFELRYYDHALANTIGPEDLWIKTTRNDTLITLPISFGEQTANVAFEVRAVDNHGLKDPNPARTVFPIRNSPPELALNQFEAPADTTWPVFTFTWQASDPDGAHDLLGIEVAFNDSTTFVRLPAASRMATFVGVYDRFNPAETVGEARVHIGVNFQRLDVMVPGLRYNATNTLYIRSIDNAGATSPLRTFEWYVRKPTSEVLLVNDFRSHTAPTIDQFHRGLLTEYTGPTVDHWDISNPRTGTGNLPRSPDLPRLASPTLRETLAQFTYIYWVTNNSTNTTQGNNLPFAAGVMDRFFEQGGRLFVHSIISLPANEEENIGNAAILTLPMNGMITFPDTLFPSLRLLNNAPISPLVTTLPGTSEPLPELKTNRLILNTLPYIADAPNILPAYRAEYEYRTRQNVRGVWTGPSTVASISTDQRVGLFALPMINELTGDPILTGADNDPTAPRRAIHLMLESLGFPRN
jgi:hypothetical protein